MSYTTKVSLVPPQPQQECKSFENLTDQLPADLNIKLRVNCRELSLLNNHRQIWSYLVLIALVGAKRPLTIGLSRLSVLAARRVFLQVGSSHFRSTKDRGKSRRARLKTFNISAFKWMADLRINDYWFATMKTVLATLEALPLDETGTAAARTSTTQDVVEAIFFTGNGDRRVAGLLDILYAM
ncbi:hypothetical protein GCG54_00015344 [Colletotrichum gloeosporioides]|uniref:Uncharacterized protein n=1 Tax=Colletotrichum gloeosporioides TaxID=474922 RepID=A0A8H4C8K6_COLGL|nr:uncharacterized protein GCG54_00015344 [Colletotrichum gloeosporioides]KAF3799156.1 hypothetical protein GCG54_00015344 [Colletotrichum gloeosporioides]